MKRFISILLLSAICFGGAVTVGTGCKSPEVAAVNVSDTAKVTADSALSAWNAWIPVGKPSIADQRKVKNMWESYRQAQVTLLGTTEAYILLKQAGKDPSEMKQRQEQAAAAATKAMADFISLVRQLGAKL